MHVLLIGDEQQLAALQGHGIQCLHPDFVKGGAPFPDILLHYDFIIDLNLDAQPERICHYLPLAGKTLLAGSVISSLSEMVAKSGIVPTINLFGVNNWPTALSASKWEVCHFGDTMPQNLTSLLMGTDIELEWVTDQAGMVTPRILATLINEAYQTQQEGAASIADIDAAMKLGTNYPMGPFEWAKAVGEHRVLATLEKLATEFGAHRFPIAQSLRKSVWKNQIAERETYV